MTVSSRNERRSGGERPWSRPPEFEIVVKDDGNTSTVRFPVACVPADLLIAEQAFHSPIIADEPVIRPE